MITEKFEPYAIRFRPILKDKIWGGEKLKNVLQKSGTKISGESWEISTVKGDISEIINGAYKGYDLNKLLQEFQSEILGETVVKKFGGEFPLLIKYIDAAKNLSVQVHPDDKMAMKQHNSFGKTEMWYIMHADDAANINVGWKNKIGPREYTESLRNGTITNHLNFIPVKEGDTFFINAGRVHAIGAGVMLAEIQQTSDLTYRVYDWDRVDESGNSRELHIEMAAEAMNFNVEDDFTVNYKIEKDRSVNLVDCDFFHTNIIYLESEINKDYSLLNSFVILMIVKGKVEITVEGKKEKLQAGQTILIPAVSNNVKIVGVASNILEIFIAE